MLSRRMNLLAIAAVATLAAGLHAETVLESFQIPGLTPGARVTALNPATNRLYVATSGSSQVIALDAQTMTQVQGQPPISIGGGVEAIGVNPETNTIYTVNRTGTVTAINGATGVATSITVLGTAPNPDALAINPATNKIYVASFGDNSVTVIDAANANATTRLPLPAGATGPVALALNPATNRVYVVNTSSNNVSIINGATDTFIDSDNNGGNGVTSATAGTTPFQAAIDSQNGRLYVANVANVTVIDINSPTHTTIGFVSLGNSLIPRCLAVNPNNSRVIVSGKGAPLGGFNHVEVFQPSAPPGLSSVGMVVLPTVMTNPSEGTDIAINAATNRVCVSVDVNNADDQVLFFDGTTPAMVSNTFVTLPTGSMATAQFVTVNPVTNRYFVTNTANSTVYALDGAANTSAPITGVNATLVAVNTIANKVYALNVSGGAGTVTVVNGATNTALASGLSAGMNPVAIAVNELSGRAYIANKDSDTVTVIDENNVASQVTVGDNPVALAVNPVLNRIYVACGTAGSGSVIVLNGATNGRLATIDFIVPPMQVPPTAPPFGSPRLVAVNPANGKAYVISDANGAARLTIIRPDGKVLSNFPDFTSIPRDIGVDPVTNRVYVSNQNNTYDFIDGVNDTFQVGASLSNGGTNNLIAVNSASGRVYFVSGGTDGDFEVLNTMNNQSVGDGEAGIMPSAVAVNSATNRVYVATGGNLAIIDGGTSAVVQTMGVGTGPFLTLAVNPVTNKVYVPGTPMVVVSPEPPDARASTVTLAPTSFTGRLSFTNAPTFSATQTGQRRVYYSVDSAATDWTPLSAASISLSSLTAGSHVLYAYTVDNRDATLASSGDANRHGFSAVTGKIEAYAFVVHTGNVPTIDSIDALTINEDAGTTTVSLTGLTLGPLSASAATNLTLTATSDTPAVIPSPVTTEFTTPADGKGKITFAPVANAFGSATITVTATDISGGSPGGLAVATQTFVVTVNPVNDAPTFTVGADITLAENAAAQSVPNFISNIVLGPGNESTQTVLEYVITVNPEQFNVAPAISPAGTLTFTPGNRADAATPIVVGVQLRDSGGVMFGGVDLGAVRNFNITLTPVADSLIVSNTSDYVPMSMEPIVANSLRDCLDRARNGDTVTFDADTFALDNSDAGTVINLKAQLKPLSRGNITIDARDRRVTVNGSSAGPTAGLTITSSGNKIYGLSLVGFEQSGLSIGPNASNNIIGGDRFKFANALAPSPNGEGLRLSANGQFGIALTGPNTTGNSIKGCWIGLAAGGKREQPNLAGIIVQSGARANTIGGAAGEANVISGNFFEGITLTGTGSDDNVIKSNIIGAAAVEDVAARGAASREDGDLIGGRGSVGNGSAGMFLSRGTQGTQAGGIAESEGNAIAFNGGNGVEVRTTNSRKNTVRGNSISKNENGGIALFDGSNDGISTPKFTRIRRKSSGTVATGASSRASSTVTISGTSTSDGTIEVFNDSSSQGGVLLGRGNIGANVWEIEVTTDEAQNITATVTDSSGNTSSFEKFSGAIEDDGTGGGGGGGSVDPNDTDGDGFTDVIETAAGTLPGDATSTPFGGAALGTALDLTVSAVALRLNFVAANVDSISVAGSLPVTSGFSFTQQQVVVDFGGVAKAFTLDAKGKQIAGTNSFKFTLPKAGITTAKFAAKFLKGSFATALADEELTGTTTVVAGARTVKIVILFDGKAYQVSRALKYTAKQGKTGAAK